MDDRRALAIDVGDVQGESGTLLARTQDEGALDPFVEDEDAASGVIWPS